MVYIAAYFGWNYVSTLADDGNYGEKGVSAFEVNAKSIGRSCFVSIKNYNRQSTDFRIEDKEYRDVFFVLLVLKCYEGIKDERLTSYKTF